MTVAPPFRANSSKHHEERGTQRTLHSLHLVSVGVMQRLALDVEVTRGGVVESRHSVQAAVGDAQGAIVAATADPALVAGWRSCAQPFQAMPLLAPCASDRLL